MTTSSTPKSETNPDLRHVSGAFDLIGDVHGCARELEELLEKLGYTVAWPEGRIGHRPAVSAPHGRKAVFVGDLVDRGPRSPDVLRIVMALAKAGKALAVPATTTSNSSAGSRASRSSSRTASTEQRPNSKPKARTSRPKSMPSFPHSQATSGSTAAASQSPTPASRKICWASCPRRSAAFAFTAKRPVKPTNSPSRPLPLGGRVPRRDRDRLRPHPRSGSRLGEQHDLYRYRLLFWRKAFSSALSEREIVTVEAHEEYTASRRPFGHPPLRPGAIP